MRMCEPLLRLRLAAASLHLRQQGIEALEVPFQHLAILFKPVSGFSQGLGFEAARTALSVAAARDEPSALQDLEVLGNGGLAHFERLGEFRNGSFARSQAGENGAPGGIGERRKSGVEAIGFHITDQFHNS